MKKKKQEQQINYLDLIPVKAEGLKWHKMVTSTIP